MRKLLASDEPSFDGRIDGVAGDIVVDVVGEKSVLSRLNMACLCNWDYCGNDDDCYRGCKSIGRNKDWKWLEFYEEENNCYY